MIKAVIGSNEISGLSCNIYTVDDLNRLRKEKNENAKCQPDLDNKRYLILNYETNFEETHYPLPLNYQGKENKELTIDYHSILNSTELSKADEIQSEQEILIEKQRNQLRQFEEKLRKRNKTIKDLKAKIDKIESEKQLLEIKNRTLTEELAFYKRPVRNSQPVRNTRGRDMVRNSQKLQRSRSYDRPWRANSRPTSADRGSMLKEI